MKFVTRGWSHTPRGISAIHITSQLSDEVFDRLMSWAIANVDSLCWSKNNVREELQGLNPYGTEEIDSWNRLFKELQTIYSPESEECDAICQFRTIVRDNPEILIWVRNFYSDQKDD